MKEFIQQMYQAIQEGDVKLFDDIEDEIKRGNIELSTEDIEPLCSLIIIDSEYVEYSQIIEIARMTLWAVEKNNMKEGLKELAKGLEAIYNEGQKDTWKNWYCSSYEDFIDRYISMAILRFKEEDMVSFGESISKSRSTNFKLTILKILKHTMTREAEKERYMTKGEILQTNIRL